MFKSFQHAKYLSVPLLFATFSCFVENFMEIWLILSRWSWWCCWRCHWQAEACHHLSQQLLLLLHGGVHRVSTIYILPLKASTLELLICQHILCLCKYICVCNNKSRKGCYCHTVKSSNRWIVSVLSRIHTHTLIFILSRVLSYVTSCIAHCLLVSLLWHELEALAWKLSYPHTYLQFLLFSSS